MFTFPYPIAPEVSSLHVLCLSQVIRDWLLQLRSGRDSGLYYRQALTWSEWDTHLHALNVLRSMTVSEMQIGG